MTPAFDRSWAAEILHGPPLIAPARQHVWPMRIPGEEDALARGALQVMVRPARGGAYLLTCALGFADPSLPTGIFACPDPEWICAVAGGYAYLASVQAPECVTQIDLKPVVAVLAAAEAELLLFVGFHTIVAWGKHGLSWQTGRLSWEGLRIVSMQQEDLRGFGWNLPTDREVEFTVDLTTGKHVGGGFAGR